MNFMSYINSNIFIKFTYKTKKVMSTTWIIVALIWGFGIACIAYSIIKAEPYPEELEAEEDEKIKKDFEYYKKGDN